MKKTMTSKHRKPYYITIIAVILFVAAYFYLRTVTNTASEIIVTVLTIIAGVAFWLEYHHNSQVNEAQFIIDLNNQFLTDERMGWTEHILEQYNELVRNEEANEKELEVAKSGNTGEKLRTEECNAAKQKTHEYEEKMLNEFFSMETGKRQNLVNYLVHLEGIATLVNNGVLRLDAINDLMAYRYFIAVNNPVVQKLELDPYKEYYNGLVSINTEWSKKMRDNMPLKGTAWQPNKSEENKY